MVVVMLTCDKVHFNEVNHEPVHVIHLIVYNYIGTPVSWNIP
jgi:hypothetical protein